VGPGAAERRILARQHPVRARPGRLRGGGLVARLDRAGRRFRPRRGDPSADARHPGAGGDRPGDAAAGLRRGAGAGPEALEGRRQGPVPARPGRRLPRQAGRPADAAGEGAFGAAVPAGARRRRQPRRDRSARRAGDQCRGLQTTLCTIPVGQPLLSDACGALSLGGRPDRDERIAWEARGKGSCADLRAFITRFPNGANRRLAADLLAAETVERAPTWSPAPRTARGYVRQSLATFGSADAAQADARARAQADAASLCAPLDANQRLAGVAVTPLAYDCRPGLGGGHVCALDYSAVCRLESRPLVERCG
jgi:hypothetical protein